jgi:hypothetical protein
MFLPFSLVTFILFFYLRKLCVLIGWAERGGFCSYHPVVNRMSAVSWKKSFRAVAFVLKEKKSLETTVRWRMTHAAGGSWIDEIDGWWWPAELSGRIGTKKNVGFFPFSMVQRFFFPLRFFFEMIGYTSHWLANPLTLVRRFSELFIGVCLERGTTDTQNSEP